MFVYNYACIPKFHRIEAAPSFTKVPSNPSFVDEGNNITLHWTYNIDGAFRDGTFSLQPAITIALKDGSGLTVVPAYVNRVEVDTSDSEATITLLGVNRSDDGVYRYRLRNTALVFKESDVKIFVRCK